LLTAAMPAAASRWPILDLTEPIGHEPAATCAPPSPANARLRPAISIGSPSEVPVPWVSI